MPGSGLRARATSVSRQRRALLAAPLLLAGASFPAAAQGDSALSRAVPAASAAAPGRRLALVLGNDEYDSVPRLENARNDARSVADELKALDFSVTERHNLRYTAMVDEVDRFVSGLGKGDDVVFFYAGHGVQIPRVGGFLLPVDVSVGNANRLERTAYSIEHLSAQFSEAGVRFSLLLIDACRDSPFMSRSVSSGFSPIEPARGQMVVFSSSKNQVAIDRLSRNDTSRNSVFTRELLRVMRKPELSIQEAMSDLQARVEVLASAVGREQRPAVYSEVRGKFYFHPEGASLAAAAGRGRDPDAEAWEAVRFSESVADFEEYLRAFPSGRFQQAARQNIRRLNAVAAERARERSASARAASAPAPVQAPVAPAPKREVFVPHSN